MAEDLTGGIPIQSTANAKFEGGENLVTAPDPVKDILVFPHQSNRTYRAGYVQLIAFTNDLNLQNLQGNIDEALTYVQNNTAQKKRAPTFNGDASAYLANARANNRRERKLPGTKMVFSCILPIPLGIGETTSVDWSSTPSGFNKSIVGKANETDASFAHYFLNHGVDGLNPAVQPYLKNMMSTVSGYDNRLLNGIGSDVLSTMKDGAKVMADSLTLGTNILTGKLIGDESMHKAATQSTTGQLVTNPSRKMMSLSGPIMDYAREAAAMNGRRQVVMDPGYWQQFQGVQPRQFTLNWKIIPENHEDAMNGLALCSRIKEFSLPESLSSVELLSPHYWQIQFSNPLIQSQTMYGNLVITNIDVKFMENGELHLSGTPKVFDITITFTEAKAQNAEKYKMYDEKLTLQGGSIRNKPSAALGGLGKVINSSSGDLGGLGKLSEKFGGAFGKLGSSVLGKLGALKGKVLGKVAGIVGDKLGGLTDAISGSLGGAVGSVFGDYAGNLIADAASNALNSAGSVLTNAIATGDFSNLGDKMKDAALAGATDTVIDAVAETANEYIGKVTDFAMDKLDGTIAGVEDWFGTITGDLTEGEKQKNEEARDAAKEAKDQKQKVEDLRKKVKEIEDSDLPADKKKKAKEKLDQEYKKAQDLAKKAEEKKKAAEELHKQQEKIRKVEEEKKKKAKSNKKAEDAYNDIFGN